MTQPLLEVSNLTKHFPIQAGFLKRVVGHIKAVENVTFTIGKGETLGLVGESGCGKTTTGRLILRLLERTAGDVFFHMDGHRLDLTALQGEQLRRFRKHMQLIFQDPFSSLNPRMTVRNIIAEPLRALEFGPRAAIDERVAWLVEAAGLKREFLQRYPHAFSGGQRQRICIARALALNPRLVVCDEPVSALDVSVQAQILNLLKDLQGEFGLTYLFIGHDLGVVEHISDRVAVMYAGRIVEMAQTHDLFHRLQHPYTEALLQAVPKPSPGAKRERIVLGGEVADPSNLPPGCAFHPRCRYCEERCKKEPPELRETAEGHSAACHFAGQLDLQAANG